MFLILIYYPRDSLHPRTDEKDFPAWAAHHIAFVISEGIFKGFPDKSFKHKNHLSAEQFATILRRILKHDNEAFGQNIQELNKLGINIQSAEQIKRGDAFDAFFTAAVLPIHNSGNSLIHVLGKEELAIQKGFINENKAHELIINNVEADNLKQIKVSFNQKVSKDNLGEFKLSDKNLEVTAMVSPDDDSVVILTLKTKLKDQKEYTLTAEKTKADNDNVEPLKKSEVKFTPLDTARPTVEKVEFTGPKHVTVTFSEPVDTDVKGTLDVMIGKTRFGVSSDIAFSGNQATLTLFSNLKEDKEYSVNVKGFQDYNKLPNVEKEFTLTYSKNTEAPEVTISNVTQTSAVFTFSKPVKGLKADKFHHTFAKYEGKAPLKNAEDKNVVETSEVSEVIVTFYNVGETSDKYQPLPEGNKVKVWIDGDKITDLWGNKLGDQQFEVVVEADKIAPEVKEVKVTGETSLRVVFTKKVDTKETDLRKCFTVKSGSDNVLSTAKWVDTAKQDQIDLTIKDDLRGKEITVEIDKFFDQTVNANKLAPYSTSVTIDDKTPPVITKVTKDIKTEGTPPEFKEGKLYVMFNENMDSATALDISNYSLVNPVGGKDVYTKLSGAIDFFNDNSVVVIELSKEEAEKLAAGTRFAVGSLKDIAGNEIVQKMYSVGINAHSTEMAIQLADYTNTTDKIVEAISSKKVKVVLNQKIYDADKSKIQVDSKAVKNVEVDGTNTIIINLETALDVSKANLATEKLDIKAGALKGEFTGDNFNAAAVTASPVKIYNRVAPVVKKDADGNMLISRVGNKIYIRFTRELGASVALLEENFVVKVNGEELSAAAGKFDVALDSGDAKLVEITLNPPVKAGEYSVALNDKEFVLSSGTGREQIPAKTFSYTFPAELALTSSTKVDKVEAVAGGVKVTFNSELYKNVAGELKDLAADNTVDIKAMFEGWNALASSKMGAGVTPTKVTYDKESKSLTFAVTAADKVQLYVKDADSIFGKDGNAIANGAKGTPGEAAVVAKKAEVTLKNNASASTSTATMNAGDDKIIVKLMKGAEEKAKIEISGADLAGADASINDMDTLLNFLRGKQGESFYFNKTSDGNKLVITQPADPAEDGLTIALEVQGTNADAIRNFLGHVESDYNNPVTSLKEKAQVDATPATGNILTNYTTQWNK